MSIEIKGTVRTDFTPRAVMDAAEKQAWTVLGKFGTYVRQRDRRSLKSGGTGKGSKSSRGGQPPLTHLTVLRDLVAWARDKERMSVVIGVAPLNKPGKQPAIIEHGGDEMIKRSHGRFTLAHYEARPHTGPAFAEVIDTQLDKLFEKKG